jgi:hypothetical protein
VPAATRLVLATVIALSTASFASAYPTRQSGPHDLLPSSISSLKKSPDGAFALYNYLAPSLGASSSNFRSVLTDADYVESTLPTMYPGGTYRGEISPATRAGSATIASTADLTDRNPPLDAALESHNPLDLAPHSVYRAAFAEFSLKFTPGPAAITYGPARTAEADSSLASFFTAFQVDTTNIGRSSQVNFDRASEEIRAVAANPDNFLAFEQDGRP